MTANFVSLVFKKSARCWQRILLFFQSEPFRSGTVAGGDSGHLASMLFTSQDPNIYFYCNSLKGLFSYKRIMQENFKKKESITVIHKNNHCEIKIMNEIKLAIYKSGSWLKRSSLTKSVLILNMLTESVDLTLVTFSNDDDDNNNVKKQLVLWEKQLLCTCITLFSTFLWRPLHDYDVNLLMRRFMEDVDILRQIFLPLSP